MSFGRLDRAGTARPMSDINMTPLIDVMLVLLVIFIVTAPLMVSSLRLDLPRADAAAAQEAGPVLALGIDRDGRLYVGDEPIEVPALRERAAAAAKRDPTLEVQLRADKTVPYGRVAEVIDIVQKAGLLRVGLVTDSRVDGASPN